MANSRQKLGHSEILTERNIDSIGEIVILSVMLFIVCISETLVEIKCNVKYILNLLWQLGTRWF